MTDDVFDLFRGTLKRLRNDGLIVYRTLFMKAQTLC
jgi:hypothetical protein